MGKVSTYTHFARIFIYLSSVTELNTDSLCWDLMKKNKNVVSYWNEFYYTLLKSSWGSHTFKTLFSVFPATFYLISLYSQLLSLHMPWRRTTKTFSLGFTILPNHSLLTYKLSKKIYLIISSLAPVFSTHKDCGSRPYFPVPQMPNLRNVLQNKNLRKHQVTL